MNAADRLAGALRLQPGPPPHIAGTRPAWGRAVALGQRAMDLPDRLASVFALCADAHRLAARLAVAAAVGRAGRAGECTAADDARVLQVGTLREHLRRIWLDWPPALGGQPPTRST